MVIKVKRVIILDRDKNRILEFYKENVSYIAINYIKNTNADYSLDRI